MSWTVAPDLDRIRTEAFAALERMPATQLLDLIANSATFPLETRLEAARVALKRAGDSRANGELGRQIQIRRENDPDFAAVMEKFEGTVK